MTTSRCDRFSLADLTDYVAGELPDDEAASLEAHLFACTDCAALADELHAMTRGVRAAVRAGAVGGFVTDAVLNRLARDGVRVRTFTLSPGAVVPCAVWEGDELLALRLRADFAGSTEVTLVQRVGGQEVVRATAPVDGRVQREVIFASPAAWVRELPAVEVEVALTTDEGASSRAIGTYTLLHGGTQQRS